MESQSVRSEKIKLGKKFTITYLIIILLISASIIPTARDYDEYRDGQDVAIAFCEDETIFSLKEEQNTREELTRYLYSTLNKEKFSITYDGNTYSNSDVVDAYREVDRALGDVLTALGYSCSYGSYYLKYGNFLYYFEGNISAFTVVACALMLLAIIINIWCLTKERREIVLDSEMVVCKKSKHKNLQFMIYDIKSVETTSLKGLLIKGEGGIKFKIKLVKNNVEIKNMLLKLMTAGRNNNDDDYTDKLIKLKRLVDEGIITQEEFTAKKDQLLSAE